MMSSLWEQKFYDPTILWMRGARNAHGKALLASNISGKFQLETRDFENNFSHQITDRPQGTIFGDISPDGKFVYFLDDKDGNETGHFARVPFLGGNQIDITPSLPPYFSYEVSINDQGDKLCFHASLNDKNAVYLVSFDRNGQPITPKLIYETTKLIQGAIISPNGSHTCVSTLSEDSKIISEITVFNNDTGKIVCAVSEIKGSFLPLTFSKKTTEVIVLAVSNMSGFSRPVFFDVNQQKIKEVKNDFFKGDVSVLKWSEDEHKLLLDHTYQARQELFLYDTEKGAVDSIGPTNGSFDLFFDAVSILSDDSFLIRWQAFDVPPCILKLEAPDYKKVIEIYNPSSIDKDKKQRKFISVNFQSTDGVSVQMWVAKPDNSKENSPFIIDIHGGPHGAVGDSFSLEAQNWLDEGFGYCAVNYRGSTGFGKKFEEDIYGNPGNLEVEDIVGARNWLVENKLADPDKIILSGWSWGGYVTLLALGKYPDLWAGGIAGIPIADFVLQYEDEPASFQSIDRKFFGGTPTEILEKYLLSSPITYAEKFRAPILIIYGENDVRCPPRQIINFTRALKERNKIIEVHKFSSGHAGGFADTEIRVSNEKVALEFAKNIVFKKLPKS